MFVCHSSVVTSLSFNLDAESIRLYAETYLGESILQKENFTYLWKLSRYFLLASIRSQKQLNRRGCDFHGCLIQVPGLFYATSDWVGYLKVGLSRIHFRLDTGYLAD